MLRTVLTLILAITAVGVGLTARGEALLGSSRSMVVTAVAIIGVLQVYRASSAWQARKRGDRLKSIPKRPLGI